MANERRLLAIGLVVTSALVSACGGGGDDGTPHDFSGNYSGTLSRIGETCHGMTESATMRWSANVVQEDRSITVNPGALPFRGTVGSDNASFHAKASRTYAIGSNREFNVAFRVTNTANTYAVTYSYTFFLLEAACTATFSGNVSRL